MLMIFVHIDQLKAFIGGGRGGVGGGATFILRL